MKVNCTHNSSKPTISNDSFWSILSVIIIILNKELYITMKWLPMQNAITICAHDFYNKCAMQYHGSNILMHDFALQI